MKDNKIKTVSVSILKAAPELKKMHLGISEEDRQNLVDDIKKNGIRDPLKVYVEDGKYNILGGKNRYLIAKELKIKEVEVEIYKVGSKKEKMELAIQDNLSRRHLNFDQKKIMVEMLLEQNPEQSSRAIAKKAKVDRRTVEKVRKESTGANAPVEKRTGLDGKTRRLPVKEKVKKVEKPDKSKILKDVKELTNNIYAMLKNADDVEIVEEGLEIVKKLYDKLDAMAASITQSEQPEIKEEKVVDEFDEEFAEKESKPETVDEFEEDEKDTKIDDDEIEKQEEEDAKEVDESKEEKDDLADF